MPDTTDSNNDNFSFLETNLQSIVNLHNMISE